MSVAIIGADPLQHTTAQGLIDAANRLQSLPAQTLDQDLKIDAAAIKSLLALDLFVGNASPDLLPPRFVMKDSGEEFTDYGGVHEYDVSHTLSSSDLASTTKTTLTVQKDSPGFLSFLGIGIQNEDTLQTEVDQTSSAQTTASKTFTAKYFLNGDGHQSYKYQVYYDVVYGSLAFKAIN